MLNQLSNQKLISLLDLTSLNDTDDESSIISLCQRAQTPLGNVAAVCVYPQFVKLVTSILSQSGIKIATVVNFPTGTHDLMTSCATLKQAIHDGANEIDAVIPYQAFLTGNDTIIHQYVSAYRETLASLQHQSHERILLKIILETGAYENSQQIRRATQQAITAGADFIKTSTGKISQGANLEAAAIILQSIKHKNTTAVTGLKISGGISSVPQAQEYCQLVIAEMGIDWLHPNRFRIGTSRLLEQLLT